MEQQLMKLLLLIGALLIIHYPGCEAQCGLYDRLNGRCMSYPYNPQYAYGDFGGYPPQLAPNPNYYNPYSG
ncbi:hypothetical protein ACLKA6_000012 [Drosophila palustris]